MLVQLYMKNVVLIDEALVEFDHGINIISGETGAGKSIIINSILFALGGRFNKDFIKKGQEFAQVDAMFYIKSKSNLSYIKEMGINIEHDDSILISRIIFKNGRSICKINGHTVTISIVKDIGSKLIDIHSQHDNQYLLVPKNHIFILDKFCENELNPIKFELSTVFDEYKNILNQISKLNAGSDLNNKIDLLTYQIDEISSFNLQEGEEEELVKKRGFAINFKKVKDLYAQVLQLLYDSDQVSALDSIFNSIEKVREISSINSDLKHTYQDLQEVYTKLEDIVFTLNKEYEKLTFEDIDLDSLEERFTVIQKLKRKYGQSVSDILSFNEKAKAELEILSNSESILLKLSKEKELLHKKAKQLCESLSAIRNKNAKIIENMLKSHLDDLGMKNIKFEISIQNKNAFNKDGFDNVEFLISTNFGEDLKPLSKIASGGEMSRVMLALKVTLSYLNFIETFIFDEIDTGISGRTAQMVSEKMVALSQNNQIICITHLPQIAAMGDVHLFIEKFSYDYGTSVKIFKLDEESVIKEIARMTGGALITENVITASKEILQQAKDFKKK